MIKITVAEKNSQAEALKVKAAREGTLIMMQKDPRDTFTWMVLIDRGAINGFAREYVTWRYCAQGQGFYYGHYFSTVSEEFAPRKLEEALDNFKERTKDYYL